MLVSACILFGAKHVTDMEGQMDKQTDEKTTKEALERCLKVLGLVYYMDAAKKRQGLQFSGVMDT